MLILMELYPPAATLQDAVRFCAVNADSPRLQRHPGPMIFFRELFLLDGGYFSLDNQTSR